MPPGDTDLSGRLWAHGGRVAGLTMALFSNTDIVGRSSGAISYSPEECAFTNHTSRCLSLTLAARPTLIMNGRWEVY